jgi:hypothetical protein
MAQENTERKKDEELTGRDLPDGDGTISDEQIQAVTGENDDRPTGQDHSTENRENKMPASGVGAIQDDNDMTSDVARIED